MSMYIKVIRMKNISFAFFFLLFAPLVSLSINAMDESLDCHELDLMVDFGYPITIMQSVRQAISQALYFLQQNEQHESVAGMLQEALMKLTSRHMIQSDDRDFIQEMIDKINALIANLESDETRSMIIDLNRQLQDRL